MRALINRLSTWYLTPIEAPVLLIFRRSLALITLLMTLIFGGYLREYFTNGGIATAELVSSFSPHGLSLFFYLQQEWVVYAAFAFLLLACVALWFGWFTRIAAILIYILFTSFMHRMPLIGYGATQVLQIALFLSIFVDFKASKATWSLKQLQIQIAFVYLFAALEKINVTSWLRGTEIEHAAYSVVTYRWMTPVLSNSIISMIFSYSTLVIELLFIFYIWRPQTRRWMLGITALMHVGVLLIMNVTYFTPLMLAVLTVFLTTEDVQAIKKTAAQIAQRLGRVTIRGSYRPNR